MPLEVVGTRRFNKKENPTPLSPPPPPPKKPEQTINPLIKPPDPQQKTRKPTKRSMHLNSCWGVCVEGASSLPVAWGGESRKVLRAPAARRVAGRAARAAAPGGLAVRWAGRWALSGPPTAG